MSNWKLTIPVSRAYEQDGALILEGEASGPERDTHRTRMLPEAIEDFERQIMERVQAGNPLPYYDSHSKIRTASGGIAPRGALSELGSVILARVTERGRLFVRAELDADNPAAVFIHRKAASGKRYGMSIAGQAHADDMVLEKDEEGNRTMAFKRVALEEISNTTAPSWVPSLGTVIARSLDADDADEETTMTDIAKTAEETAPEETTASMTVVENEEVTTPAAEAETETTEETTERETETTEGESDVERARLSKKDNATVMEAFKALASTLGVDIAALAAETTTTETTPETPVENSEKGEDTVDFGGHKVDRAIAEAMTAFVGEQLAQAKEVIEKQAEYIKKLEEMPAGKTPAAVVREKFENPLADIQRIEDPSDRLHAALEIIYQNH